MRKVGILSLVFVLLLGVGNAFCVDQDLAVSINLIEGLSVSSPVNISFRDVVVGGATQTITMNGAGAVTSNGPVNPATTGILGSFQLNGPVSESVICTAAIATLSSGANQITFTPSFYASGGTLIANGNYTLPAVEADTITVKVGGTITTSSAPVAGNYAGTVTITINYA